MIKSNIYLKSALDNTLSSSEIKEYLKTNLVGNNIQILKTVPSTNTYLKTKAIQEAKEGLVLISEEQTMGRGGMNSKFYSPSKAGIYMSILLHPNIKMTDINIITVVAAVSILEAIKNKLNIKTSIKWPNDILYGDKKLGGILTEAAIEVESRYVEYVILGIGLNVNTFEVDELSNISISIEDIIHKVCNRNILIAEILNQFEKNYNELLNNNKDILINNYRKNLVSIGEKARIIKNNIHYYARVEGIDDNINLLIREENGDIKAMNSGEISIQLF